MTLQDFLQNRTGPKFTIEVTDELLIISFDKIEAGEVESAILLKDELEFAEFRRLFGKRQIEVRGNLLAGKYEIFHIHEWHASSGIPIPTFDWQ